MGLLTAADLDVGVVAWCCRQLAAGSAISFNFFKKKFQFFFLAADLDVGVVAGCCRGLGNLLSTCRLASLPQTI